MPDEWSRSPCTLTGPRPCIGEQYLGRIVTTFTLIQSILIYLVPVIVLAVNIHFQNGVVRVSVFLYFLLIICLRWQVGVDFQTYVQWIKRYGYLDFSALNEPFSIALIKLSGSMHVPRLFFIVGGLFFMGAVSFILHNTEEELKDVTFLALMVASLFPVFIIVRQYMAVSCSVFALHFLLKRNYPVFFFMSVLGFFFHLSSALLLLIPILLFILKRTHKLFFLVIPPLLSVAIPLSLPLLERILRRLPVISNYSYLLAEPGNAAMITLNPITVGLTVAISVGVFLSIDKIRREYSEYDYLKWLIGVIGIITLVVTSNIHAGRMAIPFITFSMPVWVKLLYRKNLLAIFALCTFCLFGTLLAYPWSNLPYNTRMDIPWNSHSTMEQKLQRL